MSDQFHFRPHHSSSSIDLLNYLELMHSVTETIRGEELVDVVNANVEIHQPHHESLSGLRELFHLFEAPSQLHLRFVKLRADVTP